METTTEPPGTPSLADWLLTQITDDERIARRAISHGVDAWDDAGGDLCLDEATTSSRVIWSARGPSARATLPQVQHIASWDPARVLAECAAKRQIVETAQDALAAYNDPVESLAEEILCLMAVPYADRPGYLEEWRP